MRLLTPIRQAAALLTILPVPNAGPVEQRDLGRSVAWFPLIGLGVGLLGWLLAAGSGHVGSSPSAARLGAVGVLVVWSMLTGALHFDGFADVLDALGVRSRGRERMLEVMKDPHIGSFAVVGLMLVLLAQWEALTELVRARRFGAIVWAPVLSRWSMSAMCALGSAARPDGSGAPFLTRAGRGELLIATGLCGAIGLCLVPAFALLVCWTPATLLVVGIVWWSHRSFEGQTGDVIGFAGVLSETLALSALATIGLTTADTELPFG